MNNPLCFIDIDGTEAEDFEEKFLVGGLPVEKCCYSQYLQFKQAYFQNGGSFFYDIPSFKNDIGEREIKSVDYLRREKYISSWQEDVSGLFGLISDGAKLVASGGAYTLSYVASQVGCYIDPESIMQGAGFIDSIPEPVTTWIGELEYRYPGHNHVLHELRIIRESIPDVTYCFSFEVCPSKECAPDINIQETKSYYRWK